MALTKIPRGLLDTGIADSSDATAITIDSSENATFAGDVLVNKHLRLRTTDDQTNQWYLYTHTDDTFRINYNGAGNDEIVVNTSGNVGIGTVSPTAKLHIEVADNTEFLKATITGQEQWAFKGASGSGVTDYVSFGISGGTQAMAWQENGKVGIGTTAPNASLHVFNNESGGTSTLRLRNSHTDKITRIQLEDSQGSVGDALIAYVHSDASAANHYLGLGVNNQTALVIDNDDMVGIGNTNPNNILDIQFADGSNVNAGNVNDNSVTGIVLRNSTDSNGSGTMLKMASANGDNITAIGHEQKANNSADIVFFTESSGTFSEKMRIKNNGHVGLNSDNPYSQFEIVSTSTAAYSTSSFLASAQIGIKMPDNNGGYAGIRFTNVGGNYEGFIGFTQTTASPSTKSDFVVQGYNRDSTAYQEKFRITDGGEVSTPQNPIFMATGTGGWTAISGVNIIDTSVFSENYDRGGNFTPSNGRFTAPVTGYYLFVFHSYTRANDTSGYVYPNFYVNGTLWTKGSNTMIQHYVGHGDEDKGTCNTAHIYLTANQYVQVGHSAHGNTGSISYHGGSLGFSGHLIG